MAVKEEGEVEVAVAEVVAGVVGVEEEEEEKARPKRYEIKSGYSNIHVHVSQYIHFVLVNQIESVKQLPGLLCAEVADSWPKSLSTSLCRPATLLGFFLILDKKMAKSATYMYFKVKATLKTLC